MLNRIEYDITYLLLLTLQERVELSWVASQIFSTINALERQKNRSTPFNYLLNLHKGINGVYNFNSYQHFSVQRPFSSRGENCQNKTLFKETYSRNDKNSYDSFDSNIHKYELVFASNRAWVTQLKRFCCNCSLNMLGNIFLRAYVRRRILIST